MPDYLSQVQEEEEALGVQYELDESQHHPVYAVGDAAAAAAAAAVAAAASSSSSVQMPVISQVSSSTQHCESSSGFLSPEPLDPLEAPASLRPDADEQAAATEEAETEASVGGGGSSREALGGGQPRRRRCRRAKEPASITIA